MDALIRSCESVMRFGSNGRETVTAQTATAIAEKLKGEPLLENDQRSALENDLERATKVEIMILTPAEFLSTFDQSLPVHDDAQATPKSSTELPLDSNTPRD